MNPRSAYLLQILEKLGAPLLAAAEAHKGEGRTEAAVVAELLARAVQSGVSLTTVMDIRETGSDAESIRLALAALSGPLVAGHYAQTGKVPAEADIQRLVTALSAALTFADNFAPAAGNTARLAALEAGIPATDDTQVMIQCLQALTPVVVTIAGYSFGRPEKKMVQDVTERLSRQASSLAAQVVPDADASDLKFAELALLRAMVPLYCEAHRAETRRVLALDDTARQQAAQANGGVLPLDPLWTEFDRHLSLLMVLGQSLRARQGEGSSQRAPQPQAQPVRQPVEIQQNIPQETAQAAPPGPYNPMAFFKPGAQKSASGDNT